MIKKGSETILGLWEYEGKVVAVPFTTVSGWHATGERIKDDYGVVFVVMEEEDEPITFTVGQHFLPAFINCDLSGLSDEDIEALNLFEQVNGSDSGIWSYDPDEEPSFQACEITGMLSNCVTLELVILK